MKSEKYNTDEFTSPGGDNIRARAYDIDDLRDRYPNWDTYSNKQKYRLLKSGEKSPGPIQEERTHNVTCVGLDRATVNAFDPNQQRPVIEQLGVGTDDSTQPEHANETLNSPAERFPVTTIEDVQQQNIGDPTRVVVVSFIGAPLANDITIREVGLYSTSTQEAPGGELLNHSLMTPLDKDNTVEATYEVRIDFNGGSE